MAPNGRKRAPCSVCSTEDSKYKCPKGDCSAPYCSVKCCKIHKETTCGATTTKVVGTDEKPGDAESPPEVDKKGAQVKPRVISKRSDLEAKEGSTILTNEQLAKLSALKDVLKSKRLQEHIIGVDGAADRSSALKKQRKNPEFEKFVQELVKVVQS